MKTTTIKKLGVTVSRLGFGCMRYPMTEDGKIEREESLQMIDYAYKNGVNYFDTAYGYHDGESETFTGEALSAYPRDSFYLATKLPTWLVQKESDVDRLFDEQRTKCKVDYFDFYLIHALNAPRWKTVKDCKVYEQLVEKKKKGDIKFLGFSYHGDFDTFKEIVDTYEWDFVQIQINFVDDVMNDAKAYYDKLCEKDIPCVVMEPVRGGFLGNPPEVVQKEIAAFEGGKVSPAGWALRWCIDKDNMPVILSGMSSMEQVKENVAIFSEAGKFTKEQAAFVDRVRDMIMDIKTIPCTACGYCMDCSFGVNIPRVFDIYNQYQLFKNNFRAKNDYDDLGDAQASSCTQCGACAPMCPQGIEIPERLAEVHQAIEAIKL